MKRCSESDIDIALEAIVAGQSVRKAFIEYGIPYSTLRGRLATVFKKFKKYEPPPGAEAGRLGSVANRNGSGSSLSGPYFDPAQCRPQLSQTAVCGD